MFQGLHLQQVQRCISVRILNSKLQCSSEDLQGKPARRQKIYPGNLPFGKFGEHFCHTLPAWTMETICRTTITRFLNPSSTSALLKHADSDLYDGEPTGVKHSISRRTHTDWLWISRTKGLNMGPHWPHLLRAAQTKAFLYLYSLPRNSFKNAEYFEYTSSIFMPAYTTQGLRVLAVQTLL